MRKTAVLAAALIVLMALPAFAVQRLPLIEYFTNSG